jgi:hypothetical protein
MQGGLTWKLSDDLFPPPEARDHSQSEGDMPGRNSTLPNGEIILP